MKRLLPIAAIIALLLVSPARAASIYYSSPSGSGSTCTISAPCSLSNGIGKLVAGDTLYLRAGTYAQALNIMKSGVLIMSYPGEVAKIAPTSGSSQYTPALSISGANNTVSDLEVMFPAGKGVDVSGGGNKVSNINAHNFRTSGMAVSGQSNVISNSSISEAQYQGILVTGPSNTFIGNYVFHNVRSNDCAGGGGGCNGDWPGAFSLSGPDGNVVNTILRGNRVYENYGEGILGMSANGALIEGNTVWDNLQENIYFDHSSNSTIRGNMVYYTANHEYWLSSKPQAGIEWANESGQGGTASSGLKIYNNIVVNCGYGIASTAGGSMLVVNNTVVSTWNTLDLEPGSSTIQNNIFSGPMGSHSGATFSNNLTSSPGFVGGATYDPNSYKLQANSTAIGKALVLADVVVDFFGAARDSAPDIGAAEYGGAAPVPTSTPLKTNTPVISMTPNIITSTPTVGYTLTPTASRTRTPVPPTAAPTETRTPTPVLPTAAPTETDTLIPSATIAPTFTLTPIPTNTPGCTWVVDNLQSTVIHIVMDWVCK